MYDEISGQVFNEYAISRRAIPGQDDNDTGDWSRRRPYATLQPRSVRGARPLVDMAITKLADNIGDVSDATHLETLPSNLLWRIWRFLEARGVCLHAWKLFSQLLVNDDEDKTLGLYRFRQHICRPSPDLLRYTQPLSTAPTEFIAHLALTGGCAFDTHELLCLADMRNLGVLELIQPADDMRVIFPDITDRLVRGWAEMDDPFPVLRILRIWGDKSISQQSLRWVSKFPSLALYDVRGLRSEWPSPEEEASKYGWDRGIEAQSGLEDSLLRYLMLFALPNETQIHRIREMSRSIDADLTSLSSDSGCVVRFVPNRQAPPLVDYLTDNAKVQLPSWDPDAASRHGNACQSIAFEAWAFWLYAFIGQLSQDRDLAARNVQIETQAVAGPFVLPLRPLASLHLGHTARGGISVQPAYVSHGLFAVRRYTFTRDSALRNTPATCKPPDPSPIGKHEGDEANGGYKKRRLGTLREFKKRPLEDVLQSFSQ